MWVGPSWSGVSGRVLYGATPVTYATTTMEAILRFMKEIRQTAGKVKSLFVLNMASVEELLVRLICVVALWPINGLRRGDIVFSA